MTTHTRVAIIGTGFSGLAIAAALKEKGVDFVVLERASDIGGTWRDNTYPGCQCDVPSHLYSFSFAPNPEWSRTYSPQPEIWEYLRRTTDALALRPHIRFGCEVREASFDDATSRWTLETSGGTLTADILISGNGALAEPSVPHLPGIDRFEGARFHSAEWDHAHTFEGERVAVIGTGASAIQFIPKIQPDVEHMTVFQRTPAWVLPHTDRPITDLERTAYRRFPLLQKAVRSLVYWMRELVVIAMTRNPRFTKPIERRAKAHLYKQISDPALRAKLLPNFSAGCKRLLLSDDYYPALAQPNVAVCTSPIAEVRERSIVTADGVEHPVDAIVLGTGFRVTDNPVMERIRNGGGVTLAKSWSADGMRAHLGTTVPGFPNLFLMCGPNTGIGHTSLVVMIEAQVNYIVDALSKLDERHVASFEVKREPFERYNAEVERRMERSVWMTGGCISWYLDDHGRNPTLWPDFTWKFRLATRRFDLENYELTAKRDAGVSA